MSSSAIISIQENLFYPPLKRIDRNTPLVVRKKGPQKKDHLFGQAAIPSVLASFCNYVQSDEGASTILNSNQQRNWLKILFGDKQQKAIEHVSAYSGETSEFTLLQMQVIANEVIKLVKEQLAKDAVEEDIKAFFKKEKKDILTYLPAEIQIDALLDEE